MDFWWQLYESEDFTLYTTHSVQKSKFVPFMVRPKWTRQKKINFSDKLFSYQEPLFALSKFSWNPVAFSGELVAFEWFFQTRCLGRSIQLINFLRESVSIKGGFDQLERFRQSSCFTPLFEFSVEPNSFSKWKKLIDSSPYDRYFLLCVVFLFMIALPVRGI